ncbi:MAG: bile acid:sodium symporter [Planctomycetota bacterium]|nr:bile acid:sodium symporter [Planctomycetota bacterium]
MRFITQQWFLSILVVMIAGGMTLGAKGGPDTVMAITGFISPGPVTAIVLFLMAFTLDSRQLLDSFRFPQPVLWASCVNMVLLPLMAWGLMSWQRYPDFSVGLMIAGSVPCTLAAASVWTRKGSGNDAVSLLVTLLTNGTCFLMTPFWLSFATQSVEVELPTADIISKLIYVVLLPTAVAQILRFSSICREFALRRKTAMGVLAQVLILSMIGTSACQGGLRLSSFGAGPTISAVVMVWGCCLGIHIVGLLISYNGGRLCQFSLEDRIAVAFAGSQKTLPIGILLATDAAIFGKQFPFAVFPMLMFHATQLFVDTAVADRFSKWVAQSKSDEGNAGLATES